MKDNGLMAKFMEREYIFAKTNHITMVIGSKVNCMAVEWEKIKIQILLRRHGQMASLNHTDELWFEFIINNTRPLLVFNR